MILSTTPATRIAVVAFTSGSLFTTREIVLIETPASRATSRSVTLLSGLGLDKPVIIAANVITGLRPEQRYAPYAAS